MAWPDEITASIENALSGERSRETLPVAVVLSGHSRLGYLEDAIKSVLRQDPVPREVVYGDISEDSEHARLAHQFGVTIFRGDCLNDIVQATSSPYIIPLNSNAVLTPKYCKQLFDRCADSSRYGFVFPRTRYFGLYPGDLPDHDWAEYHDLVRENFVPHCSIIKRDAFESIGGWRNLPEYADWDLWLRIAEQGWLFAEAGAVWAEIRRPAPASFESYKLIQQLRPLTVFTPFGPGGPIRGDEYFKVLESLGLAWDNTTLLFYDNTCNEKTSKRLKKYLDSSPARACVYYRDHSRIEGEDGANRLFTVPERMAEIWMNASRFFHGAFVLVLEDDIEPIDKRCGQRLYEGLAPDVDAVTGFYLSRPIEGHSRELALDWKQREDGVLALDAIKKYPGDAAEPPNDGALPIGASGLGFSLIRRDVLDGFDYDTGRTGSWCGQDFGLWRHVRERGKRLMAHFGCRCKHWYAKDEFV